MSTKLITRYAFRETLGLVVMAVALFWPAGRLVMARRAQPKNTT